MTGHAILSWSLSSARTPAAAGIAVREKTALSLETSESLIPIAHAPSEAGNGFRIALGIEYRDVTGFVGWVFEIWNGESQTWQCIGRPMHDPRHAYVNVVDVAFLDEAESFVANDAVWVRARALVAPSHAERLARRQLSLAANDSEVYAAPTIASRPCVVSHEDATRTKEFWTADLRRRRGSRTVGLIG